MPCYEIRVQRREGSTAERDEATLAAIQFVKKAKGRAHIISDGEGTSIFLENVPQSLKAIADQATRMRKDWNGVTHCEHSEHDFFQPIGGVT